MLLTLVCTANAQHQATISVEKMQAAKSVTYFYQMEVTVTPTPDNPAEYFYISFEYTDLEGKRRVEGNFVPREDKMTVYFQPRDFLFGYIKIKGLRVVTSGDMLVMRPPQE